MPCENIDVIVRSLARLYKWTPHYISRLYMDDLDYLGIYFWYNDAQDYIKEINKSMGALR